MLFPGRHHLLTRFQAEYLGRLARADQTMVVWAVTSANHENTRRNPVPYHRREAAIERFSLLAGLRSVVVPVFDTAPTDRFADVTVKNVAAVVGLDLTPDNTIVACSTPEVAALYERLGFRIAGVEADPQAAGPAPERPWEVLLRLASGDETWRSLAHPATVDVFDRYRLTDAIRAVVNDPVVGDEGGLTATRDYRTYVDAFAEGAKRKWELVRAHVRPGRIVDLGCGAGDVLELADREPALRESDLIGVEVARHLFTECVHKKAQGIFKNPNVFFYRRNVLGGAVFPPRSVDTTLSFALTHEIWSYGKARDSLQEFIGAIYSHTVPGGVWINSDVCGPDDLDRPVILRLARDDGLNPPTPRHDLSRLPTPEVAAYVGALSTRARLDQFAVDCRFPLAYEPHDDSSVRIALGSAMDYLTRKDYLANWLSEAHEQFCGLEFADWKSLLTDAGFEIDPASHAWRNDWIVHNRLAPVASLTDPHGRPLPWPATHILTIARRPLNS
ncbi:class I SAM-dependent methyltransferase [Allorhizocola rhizosphaerae]|uniref:class I SAM-dependent methyltransferase n=1 Tax=Allorhizocola rhizosphaerae TaxID=1872709 RepID=UPI001FE75791|nr:class I SAM-dependent methyltransferase [Allorhizocola rhizosphaerae]